MLSNVKIFTINYHKPTKKIFRWFKIYDDNWRGLSVLKIDGFINGKSNVNYQSKPDKVSFKGKIPVAADMLEAAKDLEAAYLKENPDIFGDSFNKKFLHPWKKFLAKYGVKIIYKPDKMVISAGDDILKGRRIENAVAAELVDKNGRLIIHNPGTWTSMREPIKGVTKNDATVALLYNLVHNRMIMNDNSAPAFSNPLVGVKYPEKLKQAADEVAMGLLVVKMQWGHSVFGKEDKSGSLLKQVFGKLMPEKLPAEKGNKSLQINA